MTPGRQVELRFGAGEGSGEALKDLSAVCTDDAWLWIAGDEAPRLERLRTSEDGSYDQHRSFLLGDLVDLPEGPQEEVDVEGLDCAGDHLWLVGSHSRTRKRIEKTDDDAEAVTNLRTVRSHPNRHVLIRLLVDDGTPKGVRCWAAWVDWPTRCSPTSTSPRSSRSPARTTAWTSKASSP
jgi:Protein of unknown function (DUF3616)